MKIKHSADVWSGLFWVALSLFVSLESVRTGIGTFHNPGPGFLPFYSALIVGIFGAILVIANTTRRGREPQFGAVWRNVEWRKVIGVLFSLFLYSFILPTIGYLVATFALMVFLFAVMRKPNLWIREIAGALLISSATYLLFGVLMDIRLPRGLFGL